MLIFGKRNKRIYMDYAATTPVDIEVMKIMRPYFTDNFGNAGVIYKEGVFAKEILDDARKNTADILKARNDEIIFTSGGTESNNLAIFGTIGAFEEKGIELKNMHAITSSIEHPSVLECFRELERKGLEVSYLNVGEDGVLNPKDIKNALKSNTILVSIIYVNNEIGTIQPIAEIAKILRHFRGQNSKTLYFHCDASQVPLYFSINTQELGADLMTLCGQKIYGPKGIGCLYKKRNIKINSVTKGGNQEEGLRAGTENIPFIAGFAKALELAEKNREKEYKRIKILQDYFINELNKKIPQAKLNGSGQLRSPNNLNIYIPNINGEFFVVILDGKGISCSTKSACKESDEEGSYVIEALGYGKERSKSSLRFTLGKTTAKKEIDRVIKVLSESIEEYSNF